MFHCFSCQTFWWPCKHVFSVKFTYIAAINNSTSNFTFWWPWQHVFAVQSLDMQMVHQSGTHLLACQGTRSRPLSAILLRTSSGPAWIIISEHNIHSKNIWSRDLHEKLKKSIKYSDSHMMWSRKIYIITTIKGCFIEMFKFKRH